jgi:hypothetical protein
VPELLPQHPRRVALELVRHIRGGRFRLVLDEQVHVIRHHLKSDDLPTLLGGLLLDQLPQPGRDPATQHPAAVLRAPHHVQPQVVHAAGVPANLPSHSHLIIIQTVRL